jgi:hypothetical protein
MLRVTVKVKGNPNPNISTLQKQEFLLRRALLPDPLFLLYFMIRAPIASPDSLSEVSSISSRQKSRLYTTGLKADLYKTVLNWAKSRPLHTTIPNWAKRRPLYNQTKLGFKQTFTQSN